jgi:hypothetical protein
MGKAREQEVRVTGVALMALVMLAALLTVSAALALGGRLNLSLTPAQSGQDVGGASAAHVER